MSGTTYPTIGMYEMNGSVYPTQMVTGIGIIPANLSSSTYEGTGSGNMSGSFSGGGSLSSTVSNLYTYAITNYPAQVIQPWGIYNFLLDSGSSSSSTATWTGKAGGYGVFGAYYKDDFNDDGAYWIADIPDGTWSGSRIAGSLSGRFLSQNKIGTISGDILGTYNSGTSWQGVSLGTWASDPLSFFYDGAGEGGSLFLYYDAEMVFQSEGAISYYFGGKDSLFGTTPVSVTMIGAYFGTTSSYSQIWYNNMYSYNYKNSTYTTYDDGAFRGFIGGTRIPGVSSDTLEGIFYALYIDASNKAGILKGSLNGFGYFGALVFEMDGTIDRAEMATGVTTSPQDLHMLDTGYQKTTVSSFLSGSGTFGGESSINFNSLSIDLINIVGQTDWGVLNGTIQGDYSGPTSDDFTANYGTNSGSYRIVNTDIVGTKWSDSKIVATTSGYGADINATPYTWVSIGEVIGTYNDSLSTWQAVHMGTWVETNKFLSMAATSAGRTELQKLNIPCVEVGMTNLTGSYYYSPGTIYVNINNTKFFAPTAGGTARLWASGDAGGSYSGGGTPSSGTSVSLTGGPLSATFTLTTFDAVSTNKWLATITGTGGYGTPASTTFKGAAAGTINTGAASFSGKAAGTAK
jgi:hypothetical protein